MFLGWIGGSVFGDHELERYILINFGEGDYGLFNAMRSTVEQLKLKQIFIS